MAANFTAKQAYAIAVRTANLTNNQPKLLYTRLEDGLYHMIVRAAFLDYEFYVDAMGGDVLGISTEPADENDMQMSRCVA